MRPLGRYIDHCLVGQKSRGIDKELIEKERLKQRDFGFIRYKGEIIDEPIIPNKNISFAGCMKLNNQVHNHLLHRKRHIAAILYHDAVRCCS